MPAGSIPFAGAQVSRGGRLVHLFPQVSSNVPAYPTSVNSNAVIKVNGVTVPLVMHAAVLTLTAGGSGYTCPIGTISGTGTGATASITVTGGKVVAITILSQGTGYTSATIAITGGGGTGAAGTLTVSGGKVTAGAVSAAGSGYTVPTVTLTGTGGVGFIGTPTVRAGVVITLALTNSGFGFLITETIAVVISDGVGSGASATIALRPTWSNQFSRLPHVTYTLLNKVVSSDTVTFDWAVGGITTSGGTTAAAVGSPVANFTGSWEVGVYGYPNFNLPANQKTMPLGVGINWPTEQNGGVYAKTINALHRSATPLNNPTNQPGNGWTQVASKTSDGFPLTCTVAGGIMGFQFESYGYNLVTNPASFPNVVGTYTFIAHESNPAAPMVVTFTGNGTISTGWSPLGTGPVSLGGGEWMWQWTIQYSPGHAGNNINGIINLKCAAGSVNNTLSNMSLTFPNFNGSAQIPNRANLVEVDSKTKVQLTNAAGSVPVCFRFADSNLTFDGESQGIDLTEFNNPADFAWVYPRANYPVTAFRAYDGTVSPNVYINQPLLGTVPSDNLTVAPFMWTPSALSPPVAYTGNGCWLDFSAPSANSLWYFGEAVCVGHPFKTGQRLTVSGAPSNVPILQAGGNMAVSSTTLNFSLFGGAMPIWVTGPDTFVFLVSGGSLLVGGATGGIGNLVGSTPATANASFADKDSGCTPYAVAANLCAQVGTDGWFPMPAFATDAFITAAAVAIRDNMPVGSKTYPQLDNEQFVSNTGQYYLWRTVSAFSGITAGSRNIKANYAHTQRTYEMDVIFTNVFNAMDAHGNTNRGGEIVYMQQSWWASPSTTQDYIAYANTHGLRIDAISIAPYLDILTDQSITNAAASVASTNNQSIQFGNPHPWTQQDYVDYVRFNTKYRLEFNDPTSSNAVQHRNAINNVSTGYNVPGFPKPLLITYEGSNQTVVPANVGTTTLGPVRAGLTHDTIYHPDFYYAETAYYASNQRFIDMTMRYDYCAPRGGTSSSSSDLALTQCWPMYTWPQQSAGSGSGNTFWSSTGTANDLVNQSVQAQAFLDWLGTPTSLPTVISVTPSSGTTLGGTSTAIVGTLFTGATAVSFGGTPAASFIVVDDSHITATSPAGPAGTIDVRVTTPSGQSAIATADHFTYVAPAPAVTSLSPTSGTTLGGTSVVITGTTLTGATAVVFGALSATFIVNSATQITATSPASAVGLVDVRVTTPSGQSPIVAGDHYTYVTPAPTITAVSPVSGTTLGGTSVTVTGTTFTGATSLTFGGVSVAFTVVNDTTVTTTTSAAAPGLVDVRITTPAGTSATSAADHYTFVTPAPTITNVSPNTGSTAGGDTVVITGTTFTGTSNVAFGVTNTSFIVNDDSHITAPSPAHAAGTVDVRVITSAGASAIVTADHFTYTSPTPTPTPSPTITAVSPTSGTTLGGDSVTVTGTNFGGATAVVFGSVNAVFLVTDGSHIAATSPAEAAGLVDVRVTTPSGQSPIGVADRFTFVTPAPVVTSVNPSSATTAGGVPVTITGITFTGTTSVVFGAVSVAFNLISDTVILVTSPAGAVSTVDVRVTTPAGQSAITAADHFTFVTPAPTITSVSPSSGTTLGGTAITVIGLNLTGATLVTIGGTSVAFVVTNDTHIATTSPAMSPGTVDIQVTTPAGTSLLLPSDQYTYVTPAPTVTNVSPSSGTTLGGDSVTITGTTFTGTTSVLFGVVAAAFIVSDDSHIVATSPAEAAGLVDITVTTPAGTSAVTTADHFTFVTPVPAITSVSPTSGTTAGGTTVTITGTHIGNASAVKFGLTNATSFIQVSETSITAIAPAHVAGTIDITVTNPGGTSATSAADQYTFVTPIAAPTITGLSPNTGPIAGGTAVTITGTAFTSASGVVFGAATASYVVTDSTHIAATSPSQAPGTVDVRVTTPAGGQSAITAADQYTYTTPTPTPTPTPTVLSISPNSGPIAGGTSVAITGTNFTGITGVTFGLQAGTFIFTDDTHVSAVSPAESVGTVDVVVTTASGSSPVSPADQFTFLASTPVLTSIDPNVGPTFGGTRVRITGLNFTGATVVLFGVQSAVFTVTDDMHIDAISPPSPAGPVDVQIIGPGGISAVVDAGVFTYADPTPTPTPGPYLTLDFTGTITITPRATPPGGAGP